MMQVEVGRLPGIPGRGGGGSDGATRLWESKSSTRYDRNLPPYMSRYITLRNLTRQLITPPPPPTPILVAY